MSRFVIDKNGIIRRNSRGSYSIINNEGGGDCFFYSIIDSGILSKFREFYGICDRKRLVKMLRKVAAIQLANDIDNEIIVSPFKNNVRWLSKMQSSSYWADDYVINAIQKALGIRIILIRDDGDIYCNSPYTKKVRLSQAIFNQYNIERDESYVYTYNSIESFKDDKKPFILIWYHLDTHFELIRHNNNTFYRGYNKLIENAPELVAKYVKECKLITKYYSHKQIIHEFNQKTD